MTPKIRIVYVLISDGEDAFCEMTLLSLHSLRHYNPKAEVYILTDESTCQIFSKRYGSSPEGAQILTVSIPEEYEKKKRSRYLKTTLRSYISGDLLFLDCDTLICAPLEELDMIEYDLGCVPDFNTQSCLTRPDLISLCSSLGFSDLQGRPYYNSGVILAKDTPLCRQFFAEWHRLWLDSSTKGRVVDQPAFCQANINLGFPIHEISGKWNCMIQSKEGKDSVNNAVILHYFSSPSCPSMPRRFLLGMIRNNPRMDGSIENVIRNPKTIGLAVFSSEIGAGDYFGNFIFSELLFAYCFIHPLYQSALLFSKILSKPSMLLIRVKKHILSIFCKTSS